MKAEVVHNKKGEPRIRLVAETADDRRLLAGGPDLRSLVVGSDADTGEVTDVSYVIVEVASDDDYDPDHYSSTLRP